MTKDASLLMIDAEMQSLIESDNVSDNTVENAYAELLRIVRKDIEVENSTFDDFLDALVDEFKKSTDGVEGDTTEKRKDIILKTFEEVVKRYDHTK